MTKTTKKVANDNKNKKIQIINDNTNPDESKDGFDIGDFLVYPTHGVGEVTDVETSIVAGTEVTLYVLNFTKEKMTLRVPVKRAHAVGLRRLSNKKQVDKALTTLKGKPRTGRGMWSRRATEYGQKINSGDIESIAQVVRDLHKNVDDPDRSYSERVIYESAFDRLAGELAAINNIEPQKAEELLVKTLGKKAA
ncbi:MAG: CarD family transcriptional regulator [Alphaproteobacteria bacterium CG11_big_fil_rev_8_21_14_0_20_44_7]|nr:MAG: CarD family transcriptional regulator [Alphaproteobacteria bacterium CG11_big_fil_rev_8_21_14_0_20_44_7]